MKHVEEHYPGNAHVVHPTAHLAPDADPVAVLDDDVGDRDVGRGPAERPPGGVLPRLNGDLIISAAKSTVPDDDVAGAVGVDAVGVAGPHRCFNCDPLNGDLVAHVQVDRPKRAVDESQIGDLEPSAVRRLKQPGPSVSDRLRVSRQSPWFKMNSEDAPRLKS